MVALDVFTALGDSILAFFLGVLIGVSLGYIIWADGEIRKRDKK